MKITQVPNALRTYPCNSRCLWISSLLPSWTAVEEDAEVSPFLAPFPLSLVIVPWMMSEDRSPNPRSVAELQRERSPNHHQEHRKAMIDSSNKTKTTDWKWKKKIWSLVYIRSSVSRKIHKKNTRLMGDEQHNSTNSTPIKRKVKQRKRFQLGELTIK